MNSGKKSAIYLRKSRSDEGIDALRKHKEVLVRLAEGRELQYDIYEEIGSSISLEVRDELNRLFANIDQYENVIVMDIDRLSRSLADMEQIKNLFIDKDIKIVTPSQVIDLSVDSQELMVDFQSVIASAEYKQIKKRLRRGRIEGARAGNWVAGITPIGYDIDRKAKKLMPNKMEVPLIREIFNMALKNLSSGEIALKLNERGYRTRKGNEFTPYAIQTILSNMTYIGYVVYKENAKVKGRKPEEVVTPNAHPAIISELDFLEVQRLMKARRTNQGRNAPLYRTFLQGLVFCAECGRQMTVQYNSADKGDRNHDLLTFQACRTKDCPTQGIKCKDIEDVVRDKIKEQRDEVEKELAAMRGKDTSSLEKDLSKLIEKQNADIKKAKTRLDNLLDLQLDGDIDKETYNRKKDEIQEGIKQSKQEVKRLELQIAGLDTEKQAKKLKQFISYVDNLDLMEKDDANRWLRTIFNRVEYRRAKPKGVLRRSAKGEPEISIVAEA